MKKYIVTETNKKGDEFKLFETDDRQEAIKWTQNNWRHLEKGDQVNNAYEIRQYVEAIDDENCNDFSYDTVEWKEEAE